MEIRHRIMMDSIPYYLRLPSAYEKILYVTANGNQAIRTDYVPVQYDEFHIRFKGLNVNGTLLSAGINTYQTVLIGGSGGAGWYYRYFNSSTITASAGYTQGQWYDIDIDSEGVLHTNNKTFTSPYKSALDGTATSLYLFERRNGAQPYSGNVSEFWIKNNSKFKMYLIPCRRKSDQKVGMYDTISKTFFVSAKNDFIAGV